MALTKEEEVLIEAAKIVLSKQDQPTNKKPVHVRILQFSMVFLSLLLFITVGALGILALTQPNNAAAANTYTETWTATNGVHSGYNSGGCPTSMVCYLQGIPANGTSSGSGGAFPASVTVTAWSVSGTIN